MINLRTLLISILIVILPGLSTSSFADDTEIYSRKVESIPASEGSNILYMLDNSGSMKDMITNSSGVPTGERRIDVLKAALDLMLGDAKNVNVGLGRFAAFSVNEPPINAPIIFPVEYIDKDITELEGEEQDSMGDITVSIIQDADDAEQYENSGEMFLYEDNLDMTLRQNEVVTYEGEEVQGDSITTVMPVYNGQDDAIEILNSQHRLFGNQITEADAGIISLGSVAATTGGNTTIPTDTNNIVGLRFRSLNIPPNAKIIAADIEFVSNTSYPAINNFNMAIYGAGNPGLYLLDASGAAFGNPKFDNDGTTDGYISGAGYPAGTENFPFIEDEDGNELKVVWDEIPALSTGQTFNSANIKDIVQAIVSQDGWNDGTDKHHYNSLVLLLKRDSNTVDVTKSRSFYSADNIDKEPPKLRITWERSGSSTSIVQSAADLKYQIKYFEASRGWYYGGQYSQQVHLGRRCMENSFFCKGTEAMVGVHFSNLDVPKGAEILSAKITFTHQNGLESETPYSRKDLDLFIYAEDSDNAEDFGSSKSDDFVAKRPKLDTPIKWDNVPPLPSAMLEDTSWDGISKDSLPSGMNLKTVWEGDPDNIPDGYCTVDEKGIITDPECIKFTTPDLTTIVQKIVGKTGWKRNNSVGFLFETNTTRDTDEELLDSVGFRRIVASTDPNEGGSIAPYINDDTNNTTRPKLEVKYKIAFDDAVAEKQMVGLRFEAIDIPRGAKVADAYITFTSAEDISTSANLSIKAEAASAAMFNESPRNISDRTLTNASVSWSPDSWSKGLSYESPNLKSIVQEVVNNSDWCSGDLAFILSSDDLTSIRKASSFDYSSGLAPELRVRFDTEDIQPGGGCVNKTFYSNISERTDDGEEKTSGTENGNIFLLSDKLETGIYGGEERLVAFRFRAVPIGNGAQVVGAHVMVNSKVANTNNDNATFRVYGELSTNPEEFSNENFSFSKRKATATVEWKPGVWERGRVYRTSDLASIIQEIVNQPEWMAYSDIVILIKGSGLRFIVPFDDNQSLAASLRIQIKGNLGDDGQGEIMTVRRRLRNLVRRMQIPKSSTPIVGALFESAQYYLGGNVVNGKSRSNNSLYLVSHPATHNSENAIPDGCNINLNPYAPECAGEEIVSSAARYEPPPLSTSSCQSSHIVLLTDGRANVSLKQAAQQKSDIEGLIPSSCVDTFTLGGKTIQISNNEKCGIDLSDYLSEEKNIIVHTIGFQLGTAWLGRYLVDGEYYAGPKMSGPKMGKYFKTTETSTSISTEDMGDGVRFTQAKLGSVLPPYIKDIDDTEENLKAVDYLCRLASPGGGNDEKCSGRNFYLAKTVEELAAAFSNISAQATSTNSSFAAPSISVNNLNKLRHKDDIYYSVFRPKPEPRWHGNIKRYKFIDGSLKDVNNKEATNENGHIADGTTSFWSDPGDGGNVTAGGLGGELTSSNRKIYTYFGNLQPGINHRANLANSQIKPFESATATTGFEKSLVTELLVAEELGEGADLSEEDIAARDEEANNLIEWIIGNNTTEGEGSSTTQPTEPTEPDADNPEEESGDYIRIGEGDRWAFSDPLHSTPRVILYIGAEKDSEEQSEGNEESRLFVGTNDGLVRMADVANGKEKWAFMPKELLSKQSNLKDQIPEDSSGGDSSHTYGVDATPTFFINTSDGQIIPSKGNFATMYVGMRRGGRNVYAFDVTDKDGIPKPMWTIKGGEGEGTENNFIKLGQTWSAPIITEVSSDYCPYPWCRVVMFAGGYDPVVERDGKFNPAKQPITMGNAIYMVDPESGKLLWWASSDPDADLVLPKMTYAIPSDLSLQDIDGDGIIDRIYVGDIGGQLWRIDLDKADDDPHKGGIIAEFAGGSNPNMRSFFYPPALARIEGKNILTAVTGARPNPLALGTKGEYYAHDRFYAILDNEPDFDFSDSIKIGDLEDVTNWTSDKIDLKDTDKAGWYFNLQESDSAWIGEKGLGRPIVLDNDVFFITYVPPSFSADKTADGSCGEFNPGSSRFYAINLLDGGPSFEKIVDDEGGEEFNEKQRGEGPSDRSIGVATLAFDPVVMYTNSSDEVILAGTETPVSRAVPPTRVFWLQK